jgi:hypothetical protein
MPTEKRRIALSVPDEIDEVLAGIASITSRPKTSLIVELLQESLPQLRGTLEAMKMAQQGKSDGALSLMADLLRDAGFKLTKVQNDLFDKKGGHP